MPNSKDLNFDAGMEHEDSYPLLFATLLSQGNWTEQDLGKLANGNIIRVWKEVEKTRDALQKTNEKPNEDLILPKPEGFTEQCYALAKYPPYKSDQTQKSMILEVKFSNL